MKIFRCFTNEEIYFEITAHEEVIVVILALRRGRLTLVFEDLSFSNSSLPDQLLFISLKQTDPIVSET